MSGRGLSAIQPQQPPSISPPEESECSSGFDLCFRVTQVVLSALLFVFGFFALLNSQGVVDFGLGAMGTLESSLMLSFGFLGLSASVMRLEQACRKEQAVESPAAKPAPQATFHPPQAALPPAQKQLTDPVSSLNQTLQEFYNSSPEVEKAYYFVRFQQGSGEIEDRNNFFSPGIDALIAPPLDFTKHYRIEALLVIKERGRGYQAGYCVQDSNGQNPRLKQACPNIMDMNAACSNLFTNGTLRLFRERAQVDALLLNFEV